MNILLKPSSHELAEADLRRGVEGLRPPSIALSQVAIEVEDYF